MQSYFVGRQPILDGHGKTVAYELLFRSGETNAYDPNTDGDSATSQVLINAVTEMGIDKIVGEHRAFINLTNHFLENPELLDFLPASRVVLEILETVNVSDAVIAGVKKLKDQGFTIALDDFVMSDEFAALLPFADIIKYDISQYAPEELYEIAEQRLSPTVKLLAERVETRDEFDYFCQAGFDYFQGYYFAKPSVLKDSKIPGDKLTCLELLSQLNDQSASTDEIAEIMARDVSLGVRALKFVNSPMSGMPVQVTSIQQAALLLGRETIRNWVTLTLMAGVSEKPLELLKMALIRAHFCKLAAKQEKLDDDGMYFTVGLLSLLDAMMDLDMSVVLDKIQATEELRVILLEKQGRASELIDIVRFFESPMGEEIALTTQVEDNTYAAYLDAIAWADEASQMAA